MTTQVKLDSLQEICERLVMGHGSARDELIQAAMPLAENWVKRTIRKFPSAKRLEDDLTSEAYLSLVSLCESLHRKAEFDVTKIKSYLNIGIKNAINKFIDKDPLVGPRSDTKRRNRKKGQPEEPIEIVCDPDSLDMLPDQHGGADSIDIYDELAACCVKHPADDIDLEVEERIHKAKERGLSNEAIAAETAADPATVEKALTPTDSRIVWLKLQGWGYKEMAGLFDVSHVTVWRMFQAVAERYRERSQE